MTVFAPDDAAFAALPASALADQAALDGVLGYHVVRGRVPARRAHRRAAR